MSDEEGEAALAELKAAEEEELSAEAELQRRGARPLPDESPAGVAAASSSASAPRCAASSVSGPGRHAGSSSAAGTCAECRKGQPQPKFHEAFGLHVCFDCQRADRRPGGKFAVVTKSKAKDEFMLNDRQLDDALGGLGSLRLPNPNGERRAPMRLYLRSQVEELALATWGSSEGLLGERERRSEGRLQKAEAKRKLETGTVEEQILARCGGSAARKARSSKQRVGGKAGAGAGAAGAAPMAQPRHTHVFLPKEEYCEDTDMWTQRCACGFSVEYERM